MPSLVQCSIGHHYCPIIIIIVIIAISSSSYHCHIIINHHIIITRDEALAAHRLSALFSVIEVSSSHLHKHAPSHTLHTVQYVHIYTHHNGGSTLHTACFTLCTLHSEHLHPFADTVGGLLVLGGPMDLLVHPEERDWTSQDRL